MINLLLVDKKNILVNFRMKIQFQFNKLTYAVIDQDFINGSKLTSQNHIDCSKPFKATKYIGTHS